MTDADPTRRLGKALVKLVALGLFPGQSANLTRDQWRTVKGDGQFWVCGVEYDDPWYKIEMHDWDGAIQALKASGGLFGKERKTI